MFWDTLYEPKKLHVAALTPGVNEEQGTLPGQQDKKKKVLISPRNEPEPVSSGDLNKLASHASTFKQGVSAASLRRGFMISGHSGAPSDNKNAYADAVFDKNKQQPTKATPETEALVTTSKAVTRCCVLTRRDNREEEQVKRERRQQRK